MYCPDCGAALDAVANVCAECGADLNEQKVDRRETGGTATAESAAASGEGDIRPPTRGADTGAGLDAGRVEAEVTSAVPANAVAIDIPCPYCGRHPIEEAATGHRINAFIAVYTKKTYRLIGCHPCLRRELWGMAAKNLVFGWWGLHAAIWNFVYICKNVARGAVNRGPNANLVRSLEDVGVTFDYLEDSDAFDATEHFPDELYIRSFVRLGAAMMFADGEGQPEEWQAIRNVIQMMVPGYPADQLDDLITRASQTAVDIERVAEGLEGFLDPEGKQLAMEFLALVARAGGMRDEDLDMMLVISRALDLDDGEVEAALASASMSPDVEGGLSEGETVTGPAPDEETLTGEAAARWYRRFRDSEPLQQLFDAAADVVDAAIDDLGKDGVTVHDGSVRVALARRDNDDPDKPPGKFVIAVGYYDFDTEALVRAELNEGVQAAPLAGQGLSWEYRDGEVSIWTWVS